MMETTEVDTAEVCCLRHDEINELQWMHPIGVDRTMFLVWKVEVHVTRETLQKIETAIGANQ